DVQGPGVIDAINILEATTSSMKASLQALQPACDYAVLDAVGLEGLSVPSQHPIKGDATVSCIAAASILAKEYRDDLMRAYAKQYPQYGFDHHFGYGTKEHLEALAAYGH
ncbi:ribonuclease HII, partial [Veillonellaceae bacterium M2-4]|nr:ribonuclease HII [Veillonellaceae bacterium M2-4]